MYERAVEKQPCIPEFVVDQDIKQEIYKAATLYLKDLPEVQEVKDHKILGKSCIRVVN